jgi:hypothetical protein
MHQYRHVFNDQAICNVSKGRVFREILPMHDFPISCTGLSSRIQPPPLIPAFRCPSNLLIVLVCGANTPDTLFRISYAQSSKLSALYFPSQVRTSSWRRHPNSTRSQSISHRILPSLPLFIDPDTHSRNQQSWGHPSTSSPKPTGPWRGCRDPC